MKNLGSGGLDNVDPQAAGAAKEAFIHALSSGMWLSAGVALAGAIVAGLLFGRTSPASARPAVESAGP